MAASLSSTHFRASFAWARDEKPAVVGAEIERTVSVALIVRLLEPPLRGLCESRLFPHLRSRRAGDVLRHIETPVLILAPSDIPAADLPRMYARIPGKGKFARIFDACRN